MTRSERLKAIAARAEAATRGPWEWEVSECEPDAFDSLRASGARILSGTVGYSNILPYHRADTDFIAAARSDVPYLLALVERYRLALETIAGNARTVNVELVARAALKDGEP